MITSREKKLPNGTMNPPMRVVFLFPRTLLLQLVVLLVMPKNIKKNHLMKNLLFFL
jgi:hypothetical protein